MKKLNIRPINRNIKRKVITSKFLYWAYIHTNLSLQVKRLFRGGIEDAKESPFVKHLYDPMLFDSLNDAIDYFQRKHAVYLEEKRKELSPQIPSPPPMPIGTIRAY